MSDPLRFCDRFVEAEGGVVGTMCVAGQGDPHILSREGAQKIGLAVPGFTYRKTKCAIKNGPAADSPARSPHEAATEHWLESSAPERRGRGSKASAPIWVPDDHVRVAIARPAEGMVPSPASQNTRLTTG